jgi:hypothetical protein
MKYPEPRQTNLWSLTVEDPLMAKALLGHVGGPDPRLVSEVRRLQKRVSDLEAHVMRLQAENDSLSAAVSEGHLLTIEHEHEPALT